MSWLPGIWQKIKDNNTVGNMNNKSKYQKEIFILKQNMYLVSKIKA